MSGSAETVPVGTQTADGEYSHFVYVWWFDHDPYTTIRFEVRSYDEPANVYKRTPTFEREHRDEDGSCELHDLSTDDLRRIAAACIETADWVDQCQASIAERDAKRGSA